MKDVTTELYDPTNPDHLLALAALFKAHLLEMISPDWAHMDGFPAARFLRTLLIYSSGVPIGFLSVDLTPPAPRHPAVELIYIAPGHRGRGIASRLMQELKEGCPGVLHAKGPFTPDGQKLIDRTSVPASVRPAEEEHAAEAGRLESVANIARYCTHKRPNRLYACKKCLRLFATSHAEQVVATHSLLLYGPHTPAAPAARRLIDRSRKAMWLAAPPSIRAEVKKKNQGSATKGARTVVQEAIELLGVEPYRWHGPEGGGDGTD